MTCLVADRVGKLRHREIREAPDGTKTEYETELEDAERVSINYDDQGGGSKSLDSKNRRHIRWFRDILVGLFTSGLWDFIKWSGKVIWPCSFVILSSTTFVF